MPLAHPARGSFLPPLHRQPHPPPTTNYQPPDTIINTQPSDYQYR